MQKFYIFFNSTIKILDKLAFYMLLLILIIGGFGFAGFNFLEADISNYPDLYSAKRNIGYIYILVYLAILLLVLKKKYPQIEKYESIFWIGVFFLIPYFLYKIPSLAYAYSIGE